MKLKKDLILCVGALILIYYLFSGSVIEAFGGNVKYKKCGNLVYKMNKKYLIKKGKSFPFSSEGDLKECLGVCARDWRCKLVNVSSTDCYMYNYDVPESTHNTPKFTSYLKDYTAECKRPRKPKPKPKPEPTPFKKKLIKVKMVPKNTSTAPQILDNINQHLTALHPDWNKGKEDIPVSLSLKLNTIPLTEGTALAREFYSNMRPPKIANGGLENAYNIPDHQRKSLEGFSLKSPTVTHLNNINNYLTEPRKLDFELAETEIHLNLRQNSGKRGRGALKRSLQNISDYEKKRSQEKGILAEKWQSTPDGARSSSSVKFSKKKRRKKDKLRGLKKS